MWMPQRNETDEQGISGNQDDRKTRKKETYSEQPERDRELTAKMAVGFLYPMGWTFVQNRGIIGRKWDLLDERSPHESV